MQSVPLPGSQDAIASLHRAGFRLGVATNDSTSGAEKTLLALGIAQMFDAAYGYDAVANPKPAPDTIIAFCDLTGLKPSEIAMVGDNRHDLEMAKAGGAGLAVGVLSGTGTREALAPLADVVLDSIVDLPGYLNLAADFFNGRGCGCSHGEPVARDVEEERCCEGERIHPVEHAAMSLDDVAPVLRLEVALDGGEHEAAEETGDHDDRADRRRLQWRERSHAVKSHADQDGGEAAADQAFDRFRRADVGREAVLADRACPIHTGRRR